MTIQELDKSQWTLFFDEINGRHCGKPVTLELKERGPMGTPRLIAYDLPLVGIIVEKRNGKIKSIEILLDDSPANSFTHVVNNPSRVSLGKASDGEDQMLIIESTSDPTVELVFNFVAACSEV